MSSLMTGAVAYASSAASVFLLYPFRDFVRSFDPSHLPKMSKLGEFCRKRYMGMLGSPSQPLLLATPSALLYFGYVSVFGGAAGALLGGFLFGYCKMFVRTVAHRMNGGGGRYTPLHHHGYKNVANCIAESAAHYGWFSFFAGSLQASIVAVLWYGVSLAVLQQSYSRSFGGDLWEAFRIHAAMTLLTAPIRNTFRSSMAYQERSGGLRKFRDYVAAEAASFHEAGGVFRSMAKSDGIPFFMNGVVRTTFKTSVPFAFTYAVFKAFGGSIGYPNGGGGHHGAHTGRHFSRRYY